MCIRDRDVSIPEIRAAAGSSSGISSLQWGRDVSIPEISSEAVQIVGARRLQCGRDVSIPEMAVATSLGDYFIWLQWGRDVSIPEISRFGKCPSANDPR